MNGRSTGTSRFRSHLATLALRVHEPGGMKNAFRSPLGLASLVSLPILAAACGTDSAPAGDDPPPDPTPHVATYWQDVEPIFYTNCQSCHTAGGIAPFAIDDPDAAIAFAPLIRDQTASRTCTRIRSTPSRRGSTAACSSVIPAIRSRTSSPS